MLIRHEGHWKERAPSIIPLAAWAVFSIVYFGSLMPHSVSAKLATYPVYPQPWHNFVGILTTLTAPFIAILVVFAGLPIPVIASLVLPVEILGMMVIGVVLGLGIWSLRTTRLRLLAWWFVADFAFFALPNRYLFPWYTVPLEEVSFLLILVGLRELDMQMSPIVRRFGRYFGVANFGAVTLLLALGTFFAVAGERRELALREEMYACLGRILAKSVPLDWVVASPEIGALGYNYRGYILDLAGLVNPRALPYYAAPEFQFQFPHSVPPALIRDTYPETIVLFDRLGMDLVQSAWFTEKYQRIAYYPQLLSYYGSLGVYRRGDRSLDLASAECAPQHPSE